jgi:deazaflavin-dependent oxidoreductase (nitroreductase family)
VSNTLGKLYNPFVKWVLRSPLHGVVSKGVMLVTFTGRKSRKQYCTPVNYIREGELLWTVSFRHRSWWRNLCGGASVMVRLAGRDLKGISNVIVDRDAVAASLMAYLSRVPQYARYLGVTLNAEGYPNAAEVARAAESRVMVQIQLPAELAAV